VVVCRCKPMRLLDGQHLVHLRLGRNNVDANLVLSFKAGGRNRGTTRPAKSVVCISKRNRSSRVRGRSGRSWRDRSRRGRSRRGRSGWCPVAGNAGEVSRRGGHHLDRRGHRTISGKVLERSASGPCPVWTRSLCMAGRKFV
jgi:hypothetical protein